MNIVFSIFLLIFSSPLWAKEKVLLGIDVLVKENFLPLQGKSVGLITNHTGRDSKGRRTIDLLFAAKDLRLNAIFSPEHGLKGKIEHGILISNDKDPKTGVPIYSLYGKTKRPTEEMLKGIDALVYDIQDVGVRFYTYTTTLAYLLEEAAKRKIEFYVLDRPNPITGAIVEGEPLSPEINHFTAYLKVPVRHGMTVGEIAHWYNFTAQLNANLTVIKMENWSRPLWWNETNLKFVPPSPNIRTPESALLYSGIGALEATNVSVGRGTKKPFHIFGAPWMDGGFVAERLDFYRIPGFKFEATSFTPRFDLYKGEFCRGVKVTITDRNMARPYDLFIYILTILRDQYPDKFVMRWEEIERVTGSKNTREKIQMGHSAETILFLIREKAKDFQIAHQPYFLYN